MTNATSVFQMNSIFYAITPKFQQIYPKDDSDSTRYDLKIKMMSYCLLIFAISLFFALLYYSNKRRMTTFDDQRSVNSFVEKIKLDTDTVNSRDISKSSSYNTKESPHI